MRIRVTQRTEYRDGPRDVQVVGTLLSAEPRPTGSWYARGKRGRLWLVRLEMQKDDGEISLLTLDRNTRITVLDG